MTACEATTRTGGAGHKGLGPEGRTVSKLRRETILADAHGPGCSDRQVAEAVCCRVKTAENVRLGCVLEGFELAVCVRQRSDPPSAEAARRQSPHAKVGSGCGEERSAMRIGRKPALIAVPLLLSGASSGVAQTGPYIQTDFGVGVARPLTVHGSDNDWGTKCDLIINPRGVEAAGECDAAPPATSWSNELGGGIGIGAGLAFGYDWGHFRIDGEYFHRVTAYNDQTDTGIFDEVTADKREQEIELAVGGVDDLRSQGVFANAYYDFGAASRPWTPYVGAGLGVERASLGYFSHWKRNDDPARITTFADPLLRAKIAGTTTIGRARPTDVVLRYQFLAGVDRRVRDALVLGVKFRWLPARTFRGEPTEWNQLRSHESSVGRGETILYEVMTQDNELWSVSLSLKYQF